MINLQNPKALGHRFVLILIAVFITTVLSYDEPFYEDSMYIQKAKSIIEDGDYNLLNQVDLPYTLILTERLSYPSSHSNIMTPALVGLNWVFKSFRANGQMPDFFYASLFLQFVMLLWGFWYCKKTCSLLGIKTNALSFVFFFCASPMVFYGLYYLNLIGLFLFPFTSLILYIVVYLEFSEKKLEESGIALGVGSALLLFSRMSYIFPVLGAFLFIIYKRKKVPLKFFIETGTAFILTAVPQIWDNVVLYGKYTSLYSPLFNFFEFSFRNFFWTIVYGFFGLGGFFYSVPVYLLNLLKLIQFFYYQFRERLAFSVFCLLWLGSTIFQTTFVSSTVFEDHLAGRFSFMVLPLFVLGFMLLMNTLSNRKKYLMALLFGLYQVLVTINFVIQHSKGQYYYQKDRIMDSLSEITTYLNYISVFLTNMNSSEVALIVLISFLILVTHEAQRNIKRFLSYYSVFSLVTLFSFSVLNQMNYKKNTVKNIKDGLTENRVIGTGPEIYMLNYIVDGMTSWSIGNQHEGLGEQMELKKEAYYQKAESQIVDAPEWFREKLKNRDFGFNPFFYKDLKKK